MLQVMGDQKRSSEQEHRVDAKAPSTEEGRGKLRKAWGSCKQTLIPRYPNVETRLVADQSLMTEYIGHGEGTRGTETSKYPEEEKETIDSQSSGDRNGKSPNRCACTPGFGLRHARRMLGERFWKSRP